MTALPALVQMCSESYDGGPGWVTVDDLAYGIFDGVVCFRGSDNIHNWVRDFTIFPESTPCGHLAHAGFVGAFNKLRPLLDQHILNHNGPVTFVGHSLGGAIAVLFAEAYSSKAVTFGCPKVWWSLEASPVIDHDRVVCSDDPVPDVPICFKHDKKVSIVLADQDFLPIEPADHCISVYVERVGAMYGVA